MMFSISDKAVQILTSMGYDINKPMDCDDGMALIISQWAGGYLIYQQAPPLGQMPHEIPSNWGILAGAGTARKHALIRWVYGPSDQNLTDPGTGFHIKLTTQLRDVNFGEVKFATTQDGNLTLNVPHGQDSWTHIVSCTTQGVKDVYRGSGAEILSAKVSGTRYMKTARLLESAGGGPPTDASYDNCRFPHHSSLLLESTNSSWVEIASIDVTEHGDHWVEFEESQRFHITPGNSYRVECIYDTSELTEDVFGGTHSTSVNCQFMMYYKEIAEENEPFPGFCMDGGPWWERAPAVSQEEKDRMWAESQEFGPNGPYPYGCPSPFEKFGA